MLRSLVTAIALVSSVPLARADDELARARQLEAQLEYDQALAVVEQILAGGGADPARYVELHLFAGKLAAGLDRAQIAQDHFARALAVRADAALPAGTSPKLTAPFAAAKARTQPLVVEVSVARGLVTLAPRDPLGLVVGVAVHVTDHGAHADKVERAALRIVIPDSATAVEVAALDAAGNRLWVGAPPKPDVITNPVVPVPHASTPVLARWQTWAIVTGGTLAFAGVSAWRFTVAQDDFDRARASGTVDFTELEAIERRGQRWGLAANIGFGVAAAAGVATAVFAIRGGGQSDLAVAPTTNGVSVSGRF